MIRYGVAETDEELEGIIELQKVNLAGSLSKEEHQQEGFVTAVYDVDILREMMRSPNNRHAVAKGRDGKIIGYALSLPRDFDENLIPCLKDFNRVIGQARFVAPTNNGTKLVAPTEVSERNYVIMGQVCIDKGYRGKGVFGRLYEVLRNQLQPHFDCIVTSISQNNPRSMKAHRKVGFQRVHDFTSGCGDNGEGWSIVAWDWKEQTM